MSLRELDKLLGARRFPADFWACVEAADAAFLRGDHRLLRFPEGTPIQPSEGST
jgi:hypothetical protein